MEQDLTKTIPIENEEHTGCIKCGHVHVLEGFPSRLCAECREELIRYPIPAWVKGVALGTLAVMVIGFWINRSIFSQHHFMARGERFIEEKKYFSAANEFKQLLRTDSNNVKAHAYLFACDYFNDNSIDLFPDYSWLAARNPKEEDVPAQTLFALKAIGLVYPNDSLTAWLTRGDSLHVDQVENISNYVQIYPDDLCGLYQLASVCYDSMQMHACDSVLQLLLQQEDQINSYLGLRVAYFRKMKQFQQADSTLIQMFAVNKESYTAFLTKSKLELAKGNVHEAKQYLSEARKYCENPDNNSSFLLTKILFAKKEHRDEEYHRLYTKITSMYAGDAYSLHQLDFYLTKID